MKITIPGPVTVQGRPRKGMHGNFYDPSAKAKKTLGGWLVAGRGHGPLLAGRLLVTAFFFDPRPFDIDNALKALMDAANQVLWEDDKQVSDVLAAKRCCERGQERTEVEVMVIE